VHPMLILSNLVIVESFHPGCRLPVRPHSTRSRFPQRHLCRNSTQVKRRSLSIGRVQHVEDVFSEFAGLISSVKAVLLGW